MSVFHPRLTGLTGTAAELTDTSGRAVRLEEMQDRIVVLSLTPETCDAPCAAQQALLDCVRQATDATPMRDMVTFVHVQASGVTAPSPNPIAAIPAERDVSALAADLAGLSAAEGGEPLLHVTHRNGRHAGAFRGDGLGGCQHGSLHQRAQQCLPGGAWLHRPTSRRLPMTHDVPTLPRPDWLRALRKYLLLSAVGHLLWEILHTPLYTIWDEGTWGEIAFAIIHCTGGDLLIATSTLLLAQFVAGSSRWPDRRARPVLVLALIFGVSYTVFSEWLNIEIRGGWAYREAMPVVPLLDAGFTPLLQWIVVPAVAYMVALRGWRPRRSEAACPRRI